MVGPPLDLIRGADHPASRAASMGPRVKPDGGGREIDLDGQKLLFTIGHFVTIKWDMMTRSEFDSCMDQLDLTQSELAKLLQVNPRTVRRWADCPEEMPGPAEQVLRAWLRLKSFGLPWHPHKEILPMEINTSLAELIDDYRAQRYEIVTPAIERVRREGGPKMPWRVEINKGTAKLGLLTVEFYEVDGGKFSPQTYYYDDGRDIETERDCLLIDDAYACIQNTIDSKYKK